MSKIISHIKSYFYLSDYRDSISSQNIREKYRLKLYKNTIIFVGIVYLSFLLQTNINYWDNKISYVTIQVLCICLFINYFFLNKHKNSKFTYAFSVTLFYIILHLCTYGAGGVKNSGGGYLLCLILYSNILCGKKAGALVAAVGIAHYIYFYVLSLYTNWIDFRYLKNDPVLVNFDYMLTFIICVLLIWAESYFIEKSNTEVIQNVIDSSSLIAQQEREAFRLKQLVAENDLKALRSQMNPHFIFNSLNSISNYMLKADTVNANLYLSKFSSMIRQILQHSKDQQINLIDEVKFLELYLELENLRFGSKMKYKMTISKAILQHNIYIPSMVIQPYVEYVIKHAIHPIVDNVLLIIINFELTTTQLICTINSNGSGNHLNRLQKDNNHSEYSFSGVDITQNRIDLMNSMQEGKIQIEIIDKHDINLKASGTIIRIVFPVIS
jgi:sensor histidine kinase YesM